MARADTARRDRRGRSSHANPASTASDPLIERINTWCEQRFQKHGRWISRHQISTLLICSLVITSLFYPAVGIYFYASEGGPGVTRGDAASVWRSLGTPFMDSFSGSARHYVHSLSDLRMVWDDAKDLLAVDIRDADTLYGRQPDRSATQPYLDFHQSQQMLEQQCRTIRVEHVLVTTDDILAGRGPRYGALDRPILQSALKLHSAIQAETLPADGETPTALRCLQPLPSFPGRRSPAAPPSQIEAEPVRSCLTLSPLEYWQMDDETIQSDDHPEQTAALSTLNTTLHGAPLSLSTTLAGRWHLFEKVPRAEYLAMTFFLQDQDDQHCKPSTVADGGKDKGPLETSQQVPQPTMHATWLKLLTSITSGQVTIVPSEQTAPRELMLQFSPLEKSPVWTMGHVILLVGYAIVLVYIGRGLVKMRKVHSRFGLAFTGLIELVISMIMSISICALLGVRLTLVPWELLPFVIVVVGSENMFVLTSATVNTPLSLTVPARIAHGLSKAGGPIAMTTLADMMLLSFIAVSIGVKAVQEFCIFAILSLVMDFFLQMTFFITILSIDMQRLELADLLTQGTRSSQALQKKEIAQLKEAKSGKDGQRVERSDGFVKASFKAVWRARTARTASLALILAFLGGLYLYYGTGYPTQRIQPYTLDANWSAIYNTVTSPEASASSTASSTPSPAAFDPFAHLDNETPQAPWWTMSPSADLWQSLNPHGAPQVRVIVEPWTILSLRSGSGEPKSPLPGRTFAGWALFRPRVRAILWFVQVVVLPISGTSVLLWMLLLYLLKDTELLDAQRDKCEADDEAVRSSGKTDDSDMDGSGLQAEVTILSSLHQADVDLIAESHGVVVSVDTDACLRVWKVPSGKTSDEDGAEEMPERTRLSSIRSGKTNDPSLITALAVSASSGIIVLGLASGRVCFVSLVTLKLVFEGKYAGDDSHAVQHLRLRHRQGLDQLESIAAISIHQDGSAHEWIPAKAGCLQILPPRPGSFWTAFDVDYSDGGETCHAPVLCLGPLSPLSSLPTIAMVSSDRRFEVRRQRALGFPLETVFETFETDGAYFRSAAICTAARRSPTGLLDQDDGSVLVSGQADGVVRAWELRSRRPIGSLDLGDGPVVRIRAIQEDDPSSCIILASTTTRASLLTFGPDLFGHFNLEASASLTNSLNGLTGTSPIKGRSPSGNNHLSAPTFWADASAPTTPTSEMPNPPSYPISSHGNAARLRRASGHGRDRSSNGGEFPAQLVSAAMLPSGSFSSELSPLEERQLRLIGSVPTLRGGAEVLLQPRCLVGVRRKRRAMSMSDSLLRRRRAEGTAAGSEGHNDTSTRWEFWTLDLRSDFQIGRNGEIVVSKRTLRLDGDRNDVGDRDRSAAGSRSSNSTFRSGASQQDLAFSRLHPTVGAYASDTGTCALLFAFGGSIGCVTGKFGTSLSSTEQDAAARFGGGQRRSKSSGGSVVSANGGGGGIIANGFRR